MNSILRQEIVYCIGYAFCILISVMWCVFVLKGKNTNKFEKIIALFIIPILLAVVVTNKAFQVVSICHDYKNSSYDVVEDAEVYVWKSDAGFESGYSVRVKEKNKEDLELHLTGGKFEYETETDYQGTVVYAKKSKRVLLLNLYPIKQ